MRLRLVLVLLAGALLAGCASGDHAGHGAERWTFTQRSTVDDVADIGSAEGFNVTTELRATGTARQIGGQWHATFAAGEPFTLTMRGSVDMAVEWRLKGGDASVTGTCDWGPEGATKDVALGSVRMANTTHECTIELTPHGDVADPTEPTFRWEARSREPQTDGWTLAFSAGRASR